MPYPISFRTVPGLALSVLLAACASASSSSDTTVRASKAPCDPQPPQPLFEFMVERPVSVEAKGPPSGIVIPRGQGHEYTMQFVATPAGTVDSATFRLLDPSRPVIGADGGRRLTQVTDSALVALAWHVATGQRLRAAEIRGCTVPQVVQQSIVLPADTTAR